MQKSDRTCSTRTARTRADVYAAFVQQVLDVAQRQREPHIHHYSQADDLG
jgi:hypothetical protein